MIKKIKIAMVGGGSYNWCPHLLSDLIQTPELEGSEVVLLDLNLAAAKEMKAMADRLCADNNKNFHFTATNNEDTAFKDADFVVITISTGGLEMMRHDLKIPERYGIWQTVGDSVGPGGWSRLLRNVPVFEKMARKIEKLSPRAVILNYTNPMAGLTSVLAQTTSLRTVGLCHGLFSTYDLIKKLLQVEEKDISVRFGGINHFFWLLDFKVKGEDGYPLLMEKLRGISLNEALDRAPRDTPRPHDFFLCEELLRQYGMLTYIEDRHTCEYFPGYLTDPAMIKRFKLVRTTVEERKKMLGKNRKYALKLASGEEKILPRSRETAMDIIKAFVTNTPFVDVVNLPNIGQIDNLPRGAVVETLGLVDSSGFAPIGIGSMPEPLRTLLETHCQIQKMTLEAALTGNKELALKALMLDPLCAKLAPSDIRKMGLELMEATSGYLPQFN
jgi:alpha-galactosidase/6-phospho-beta-glucosidase family protein